MKSSNVCICVDAASLGTVEEANCLEIIDDEIPVPKKKRKQSKICFLRKTGN